MEHGQPFGKHSIWARFSAEETTFQLVTGIVWTAHTVDWPPIYELPRCFLTRTQNVKSLFHLETVPRLCSQEMRGLACAFSSRGNAFQAGAFRVLVRCGRPAHRLSIPAWGCKGEGGNSVPRMYGDWAEPRCSSAFCERRGRAVTHTLK